MTGSRALTPAVLAVGSACGLASLAIYRWDGYGRSMLYLWLAGLLALAVAFWRMSGPLPHVALGDIAAALASTLAVAPLYLIGLYRWPIQMSSDEVTITNVAKAYAAPHGVDPFGLSFYFSRPALLFLAWGRLGELFGGFDLYHMRLLHAVFGLLVVAGSYALFRQLLPRGWAVFATCLVGVSHSFFMISRLAMRENTSVLCEVVALALLLWGLRNDHPLSTFLGGLVAGLGFYVYFPARSTFPLWLLFLVVLGLLNRKRFPARRLAVVGSVAAAGFVLIAGPVLIAESKAPPGQTKPNRETFLLYPEGRALQQRWVFAPTVGQGIKKNIVFGLGAYNNRVDDHGYIYGNPGHGFVDPLTGILLWVGVGFVLLRLVRREPDDGGLLMLSSFVVLWLSFAFLINKAPNYTRLLVTLPFVAYFVTEGVRRITGRWRSPAYASAVLVAGFGLALVAWNLAIARDFMERGKRLGEPIGNTGRYVVSHRDIPGIRFYLAGSEQSVYPYYPYGPPRDRLLFFARSPEQVPEAIDLNLLGQFKAAAPFVLFMRSDAWAGAATQLAHNYPGGRVRNVTPDGTRVVLEVLPATRRLRRSSTR